mgnify:CR=1 FL=1
MLKVENLSTSYKLIDGDVHVLNDLNFEIHDNAVSYTHLTLPTT